MKLGIVGLPNVGKSTIFNALTNAGAQSENYPFCTIEPNIGIVSVPDPRLEYLKEMYKPDKFTPATIEFVDIAGLVKGASKGEGLGNQFLANIREVDAILHVVRCFENGEIVHVEGNVDPIRDIEIIEFELILSDIETVQRKVDRAKKAAKGDKAIVSEVQFCERLLALLEDGKPAKCMECKDEKEQGWLASLPLLTNKPVLYVANVSEDDCSGEGAPSPYLQQLIRHANEENAVVLPISAKLESEIALLDDEEKGIFLNELGLKESGLSRLIRASYTLLGLISFFTAGKQEVRAWTIKKGTKAPQAAGKIHSDFERGFIRAEVIAYNDLIRFQSMAEARENGLVRSEGKNYPMKDADVVLFRFNV